MAAKLILELDDALSAVLDRRVADSGTSRAEVARELLHRQLLGDSIARNGPAFELAARKAGAASEEELLRSKR
jgi:hypothetical protein